MCKQKYQEALGYWTIGLQYLHLVEAVIAEIVAQRNAHVVISDEEISWDQYERVTKWTDHRLVIPVLFDFYHGIEIILKGFLVAANIAPKTNHKLSQLVSTFEKQFPENAIDAMLRKYTVQEKLPELLSAFCRTSGITIDNYYQALKYPKSTSGDVYKHCPLKYRGEEGVPFFEDLAKDIGEAVPKVVALGRSICQSV
jgi:hypothetical protein